MNENLSVNVNTRLIRPPWCETYDPYLQPKITVLKNDYLGDVVHHNTKIENLASILKTGIELKYGQGNIIHASTVDAKTGFVEHTLGSVCMCSIVVYADLFVDGKDSPKWKISKHNIPIEHIVGYVIYHYEPGMLRGY